MSIAIRETTGEAEYKTKQEFPSVEEAYQEKNSDNAGADSGGGGC
jgi:hypothetical protein